MARPEATLVASRSERKSLGRKRKDPVHGDEGLFGQHLAELAARANLTAEQLADKIGKDRDTITLYFSGSRLPRLRDYRKLALALGLKDGRDILPPLPVRPKRKKA